MILSPSTADDQPPAAHPKRCHRGARPLIRREIWQGLAQLKANGHAILVIDKNLEALIQITDRHCSMQKGRVVWQGHTGELAAAEAVKSQYLGV